MRRLLALVLCVLCTGEASAHSGWYQFRKNAANNPVLRGRLHVSWRLQTDGPFSSTPAFVGNRVYIGNNSGTLYAIDARTGAVEWTFHAKSPLMSNPLVINGQVIVSEGNQGSNATTDGHDHVGTSENAVISVDAATGKERWRVPLEGTGMPTPAIIGGMLVEHDGNGFITGIDVAMGTMRYRRFIGGAASMVSILPVGNNRFITAGHKPNAIWEIDARTGDVVWQAPFDAQVSGLADCPPAADGTYIFCDYALPPPGVDRLHVDAAAIQHVFALDARTGSRVWDEPLANGTLPQWNEAAIPVVRGGVIYVGSSVSAEMHAVDAQSGRTLWTKTVNGRVKSAACVKHGIAYFGDGAGYLWALDAHDGRVIGVKNMHTVFNVGSPIIAGQTLIAGTNDGEVLAIPLRDIREGNDR